ncbi:thimet oligopeptidase isoform X2 [Parasteatoda tepidariorum]|nr:thimet oligopeptidase isoform X2 [Parasteatoda tepidariorum]
MPVQGVGEDWSLNLKPEDLINRAKDAIEKSRKVYDSVAEVPPEDVSYDTVLKALADMSCWFSSIQYFLESAQHISTDSTIRDASCEAEKLIRAFNVESSMREDVFKKLQVLESKNLPLKPEAKRYLDKLVQLGKRNGLHLSKDIQEELKTIKNKIDELAIQFSKNLNELNTTFEFEEKDLLGMPSDFLANLKKNPDTGKYVVGLKYPDYIPIMQKCKVPETRQKMELEFNSQCATENHPLLDEITKLRHKAAILLGYPSHAAFITEILMSKTADNVNNFLMELKQKLAPLWVEEKEQLLKLKENECKELGIPFDGKLNAYDLSYYTYKIKEIKYDVDQAKVKEYFPMHVVKERILTIYQKLLGLTFSEVKSPEVWHKDVAMYSVTDTATSELLGYFYLDLFPRPGKYSHACLFEMQAGCLLPDGSRQLAVGGMLANFTESKTDKPSLMNHDEVTTFFHEFGHVMHYLCSKADFAMFSGTNVERDFVEAPSQMLENWCWEPESLKELSSHYEDKSVIPDSLLNNLIKSRQANTGYTNLRQLIFALYDFKLHSSDKNDVKETYAALLKDILGIPPSEGTNFGCNFRHIIREYDAQYYGYLWSEVYSLDMFDTRFKQGNNVLNPTVGMDYRRKILQPGGTKDATEMLQDFLGRKPSNEAFLRSKGLKV